MAANEFKVGDKVVVIGPVAPSLFSAFPFIEGDTTTILRIEYEPKGDQLFLVEGGNGTWWRGSRFEHVEKTPEAPVTPWWEN